MNEKQIAELVYCIAGARKLIDTGDVEGANGLLDRATEFIPDELYTKELAEFHKLYHWVKE